MKITISEVPEKHPKLVRMFKEETGRKATFKNGKITKGFKYWLRQKIKYKDGFICNICGREFDSKFGLGQHLKWHKPGYMEKMSGENHPRGFLGKHFTDKTRKIMSDKKKGENHPNYGKRGDKNPNYKEDAKYGTKHAWIRIYFPPEDVCQNKCEICDKFSLDLELARFRDNNERKLDNPMIDYLYVCPYVEKNSCHSIYDKLTDKQKKELLKGATTREEKLKRIREYVMKMKK